ncbi:exodeoxyribonuclease V alpha subunit [Aerococcus urinaehominis]|uniref:SF1B family DNA helicase RecD2 n=1 Tax=Aerococcus urinaehominis TaxID=128944 RepID=UPI00088F3C5C|nr:ATP-dependent RecD-like DNA helicase [Aerococcus urinaehominis]SDM10053.1 exodeoxyribonuclease V alpha subunit [Aerococcus urinaehominis]
MTVNDQDYMIGEITAVYFENLNNYYRVMAIDIDETNTMYSEKKIVVTGNFVTIQQGSTYKFYGRLVDHSKYGVQFQVTGYDQVQIASKEGLIRYFSSEEFPGIGKVLASRIVDHMGDHAIESIINDPDQLKGVKGLSESKRLMILERLKSQQGDQQVFIKLAELGFSANLSSRIYGLYQQDTLEVIQANPYCLIEDLQGFGFQKADQLAQRLDFPLDAPVRLAGGFYFILNQVCYQSGNTYIDRDQLLGLTMDLLSQAQPGGLTGQVLADTLSDLCDQGKLIAVDTAIALPSLFYAEVGIAKSLDRIKRSTDLADLADNGQVDYDQEILAVEEELGISYGLAQKAAIKEALTNKFFILTGGPGTGKTTVLNGIVKIFAKIHDLALDPDDYEPGGFPIAMAAPTGRAAKRMQETTGLPASTIHRLLGLTSDDLDYGDQDLEAGTVQLQADLLIIDEMSMVDTWLAHQLLAAVPPYMQIILVGDKDQLPSVGPGQVLSDLIRSGKCPGRELDEIYRQDDQSTIVNLAHQIKEGIVPPDLTKQQADRSYFELSSGQMAKTVAKIAKRAQEKGYDLQDIQVLAPMYKGLAGIDKLNACLQATLNPNEGGNRRELVHFDQVFRVGDKVLQLKNQAEKNIFNGDLGQIVSIFFANEVASKTDEMVVAFDDLEVTYSRDDFKELTLAYCTSIHKAQGSEFPIVILPMVNQYSRMLKRNLVYTAITRAKQSLIMCGEKSAWIQAIQSVGGQRLTLLYDLILMDASELVVSEASQAADQAQADQAETNSEADDQATASNSTAGQPENQEDRDSGRLTPDLVRAGQVDPLIGMAGLTPYDF